MTCESIFQILSSSLAAEEVERLCHKHRVPLPAVRYGKVALYQAAHYEHIIAAFGGDCRRHTGNQGQKKLAEVIKQADIVFCLVDCNSHVAAATAKKLCRRLHKSCYFLRSSGLSHLKEKLRELASGM
jgi:hypothetical protein